MAPTPKLCRSGTGRTALKGTFAPGGDATYKSGLIKRVLDGDPTDEERKNAVKELKSRGYDDEHVTTHDFRTVSAKRALEILKDRDWEKFLTQKREAIAHKTEKARLREEQREAAKKEAAAKAKADAAEAAKADEPKLATVGGKSHK